MVLETFSVGLEAFWLAARSCETILKYEGGLPKVDNVLLNNFTNFSIGGEKLVFTFCIFRGGDRIVNWWIF